jgi:hypothetical protein
MQIQSICMPNDTCEFKDTCDMQYIGFPTLDTSASATDALWLLLQVENQTPDNENVDAGRLNTRDAHIDESTVEYEGPAIPKQVQAVNYLVPAESHAVVSVMAIPPGFEGVLDPYGATTTGRQMLAKIRLRGYWDDGTRFETAEFPVGVKICSGCVGTCPLPLTCPPNSDGQLPLVCMDPNSAGTT